MQGCRATGSQGPAACTLPHTAPWGIASSHRCGCKAPCPTCLSRCQDIGETLLPATRGRMVAGISPDGSPFAPRSPLTLERYAAQGERFGTTPLNRTGHMHKDTLHYRSGQDFVEIGSSAIQAAVMHFGAQQGEFGTKTGRIKTTGKHKTSQDYFVPLPWGGHSRSAISGAFGQGSKRRSRHHHGVPARWLTRLGQTAQPANIGHYQIIPSRVFRPQPFSSVIAG